MENEVSTRMLRNVAGWHSSAYDDLKQALAGCISPAKPTPDPLAGVSDSDLVMELLARGFIIQKAPTE